MSALRMADRMTALLRRQDESGRLENLALLPQRHPQYGECERHGRYPITTVDAAGIIRYLPPRGCPRCCRERDLALLLDRSAIPARYQRCTLDNFQAPDGSPQALVLEACRQYVQRFPGNQEGEGMLLLGPPGTGKNHLAAAMASELLRQGYTVLQVTAWEILQRLRETWREHSSSGRTEREVLDALAAVDLLILDEADKHHGSPTDCRQLFMVLDRRYRECRATAVIANSDLPGLESLLGTAAVDRLCQNSQMLRCSWPSYRRKAQ